MMRRPPGFTRTDTLFPYTPRVRAQVGFGRGTLHASAPKSSGIGQGAHRAPCCFLGPSTRHNGTLAEASTEQMTDKATQIATLLAPTIQSLGLDLLGAEYLPAPGSAVLSLHIDVPVDADDGRLARAEEGRERTQGASM